MPDFPQRKLRANHGKQRPAQILFYDSETRTETSGPLTYHSMYMGWTYYVRLDSDPDMRAGQWVFHTDPYDFCKYVDSLTRAKTTLYIIAHNVFFDLHASGFDWWFPRWDWCYDFGYDSGLTYILVLKRSSATIKILSTTNYFTESLRSLGSWIGLPKLDVDFATTPYEDIKTYCRRDVEIIVESMRRFLRFIDEHDCGSFGMTRASQSMRAYRHRFMTCDLHVHEDSDVLSLERAAYMGGRTECFYLGKVPHTDIVALDINSMYPYVMREHEYPIRLIDYRISPPTALVLEWIDKYCMAAEIDVYTDEPVYGVRMNGKICYPVGRFRCFVTTPGMRYAIEHDHLVRVHRLALYDKGRPFVSYVDYFYDLKRQAKRSGDTVNAGFAKIFMNSLYGKFGQKYTEEVTLTAPSGCRYFRLVTHDLTTGETELVTTMYNKIIVRGEQRNGRHSIVCIPAHVTEYARLYLWQIIKGIGPAHVYYCDTDSVYVGREYLALSPVKISPDELGALSVDGEYRSMTIYGCKDYAVDDTVKIKGVPRSAVQTAPSTWEYDQFLGPDSHLRMGEARRFVTRRVTKTNKRIYDKGKVTASGQVRPFRLWK